jgi:hypothetical protein
MEGGHARITLTSVAETADRVLVVASDRSGRAAEGSMTIEFL